MLSLSLQSAAPSHVLDTVRVYDTVRTTVVDTVRVRLVDTLGVVLPSPAPESSTSMQAMVAAVSAAAAVAAVVASWRAATASRKNADAAKATADASVLQAAVAAEQAALQRTQWATIRETQREDLARQALSLKLLSLRMRVPLTHLKQPIPSHAQLRAYVFLREEDILHLEQGASRLDPTVIRHAGMAAVSLRALVGIIGEAKSVNEGTGWVPTERQSSNWSAALSAAVEELSALEQACDRVSAS